MRQMSRLAMILAVILIASGVRAQMGQQAPGQAAAPQASPGGMMGGMGGGGGMMGGMGGDMSGMMGMMAQMHGMCGMCGSLAANDDSVYVLRGNDLYRFDKNSLRMVAHTTLPVSQVQGSQQAMAGTLGMGGMSPQPASGQAMSSDVQAMITEMRTMPAQRLDREFMRTMMMHHAGAITMSTLARYKAEHRELRQFARNVIDTQTRENRQFTSWLGQWYDTAGPESPTPMDQQMTRKLQTLSGRDFDIQYMQAMIMHHNDAIEMARIAEQRALHPDLRTIANDIADSQSREIEQLRGWLAAWYGITSW